MRFLFAIAPLCLSASAFASEAEPQNRQSNIFNADLSNPDLALAVSHFQETCMPFVLHETELLQDENMHHYAKLMENQGLEYQSSETRSRRVTIEPSREEWKPPSQAIPPKRTFTVYNGLSDPVTESTETIVNHTGEIDMRAALVPAIYKTVSSSRQSYYLHSDSRLSARLDWNYASQNHPGKSCEIKLTTPTIDEVQFTTAFIEKDSDWMPTQTDWSQCVRDGEDEFEFTVQHHADALSLHVKRNDFYETDICEE